MKLTSYLINGQPVGSIVRPWLESDLNGNIPFKCEDYVSDGYSDISSVYNWYSFGDLTGRDYNFIRNEIMSITNIIGFSNLNDEEKIISASLFVVNKTDRDSVLSDYDQKKYWNILVQNSLDCREKRWSLAKSYISYNILSKDSSDLGSSTSILCNSYINYNITDDITCGTPGLYDFLEGTSIYANNGYPNKSYWNQQDQDKIMNILKFGN